MSESDHSQHTNSVSDVEYEDFLVQINDMMQDEGEDPLSQGLDQKIASLEKNVQKQLEQNCLDFKRLNIDSYQEIKTLDRNQSEYFSQQLKQLKNFEDKVFSHLQQSHTSSLEAIEAEVKTINHHFSGEVHNIHQCLEKHSLEVHEEKTEMKKELELLHLELKKTEERLKAGMRSHHLWVVTSIIAALALYKVLDVMLFQTLFITP
ncbi:MAG: hypothetical protein Q9M28_00975 [Mariprofundaceae bacterium]|nr:hypothetical protein [Mariprofundaceae bacterium]